MSYSLRRFVESRRKPESADVEQQMKSTDTRFIAAFLIVAAIFIALALFLT